MQQYPPQGQSQYSLFILMVKYKNIDRKPNPVFYQGLSSCQHPVHPPNPPPLGEVWNVLYACVAESRLCQTRLSVSNNLDCRSKYSIVCRLENSPQSQSPTATSIDASNSNQGMQPSLEVCSDIEIQFTLCRFPPPLK